MNMNKLHIVAGGGPAGLMTALLLTKRYPSNCILLLEQSNGFGGLYNGFDYGAGGLFDNGMHVLYETGIREIDTMLRNFLPREQWNILEGNRKDIAGIHWNGHLQTHSPYLDLRRLPKPSQENCLRDFFAVLYQPMPLDTDRISAEHYLVRRFGPSISSYLIPCLEKLYQQSASTLSPLATRMPTMDRVILFDENIMQDLMQSVWIRSRLAYPHQLTLPPGIRKNEQAALYPKEFGMGRIITSMLTQLREAGVRCLTRSAITSIRCKQRQIATISAMCDGKEQVLDNVAGLYWTAGLPSLGRAMGLTIDDALSTPLPESLHVNLRLNELPDTGQLYHFYCFDAGYHSFRVTNYSNYCPHARNNSGYPLCVELWPPAGTQIHDPVSVALQEPRAFGIISIQHTVTFSDVKRCRRIHAMFTMEHVAALRKLRYDMKAFEAINLMWAGVLGEDNTLLLYEILRDIHGKLANMY